MSFRRAAAALALVAAVPAWAVLPTVPAAPEAAPAAGAGGLLQAGLGMVLVLGLIFLCAWLARRFGLQRFGGSQLVKVVSTAMVGQRERVVVVEVGGTWLVLGVTPQQVTALHTMAPQALPATPGAGAEAAPGSTAAMGQLFAARLREALGRKPEA